MFEVPLHMQTSKPPSITPHRTTISTCFPSALQPPSLLLPLHHTFHNDDYRNWDSVTTFLNMFNFPLLLPNRFFPYRAKRIKFSRKIESVRSQQITKTYWSLWVSESVGWRVCWNLIEINVETLCACSKSNLHIIICPVINQMRTRRSLKTFPFNYASIHEYDSELKQIAILADIIQLKISFKSL